MKYFYSFRKFLLTFLVLIWAGQEVAASHAMGADLILTCTGGNDYLVRLSLYRDCDGITPLNSYTININSASCGQTTSLTVNLLTGYPIEVSPLCPTQIGNSTCNNGTLPGVEEWIYEGTFTLPMACNDWTFSFREGNRNAAITTLSVPGAAFLYIETILDNLNAPCNNSPTFTSLPVPYICLGQPFSYNHGAIDPDGDSLVYSLIDALDNTGSPVTYNAGFSGVNPMTSTPPVTINASNGTIDITPTAIEIGVVAVLVEEFRNGVLIGSTIRDIQVTVLNCGNNQPTTSNPVNIVNGFLAGPTRVEICPGQLLNFDIIGTDPDVLDSVLMSWNNSIPGATFTTTGRNPATGTFSWTPSGNDVGSHSLVIFTSDNGCPVLVTQSQAIEIVVLSGTSAGPDQGFCASGVSPILSASGGSSFTWTVISGDGASLSCSNCSNPTASPNTTTVYEVVSNLGGTCGNRDTVTVNVVPDFTLAMSSDTTVCLGGGVSILATPSNPGSYTYNWTPAISLANPTSGSPTASPNSSTTYVAEVTSAGGCVSRDSMVVNVGPPLNVAASTSATIACQGDVINLSSVVSSSPSACGPAVAACSSPSTMVSGTGTSTTAGPTPYDGFWEDGRVQYLYRASELNALGFTGGTIDGLAFEVATKGSTQPFSNFNIRLGCTSLSEITTFQSGLTLVYTGNPSTAVGWNSYTLATAYDWDGVSNLIVEVCYDNASYTGDDAVFYTATTYNSVVYDYADSDVGCTLTFNLNSSNRANTRFSYCNSSLPGALTYNWSPAVGLSTPTNSATSANLSSSTTYSVLVTDVNSGCVTQDQVVVDVASVDAGNPQTICIGDSTPVAAVYSGPSNVSPSVCGPSVLGCLGATSSIDVGLATTSTGSPTPYEGFWHDGRIQILYTAAELNGFGFTGGTITSISFETATKASTQPYSNFTIRMGCTNLTSLSTFEPGLSQVFNGAVTTVLGVNTHTLNTPYDWDGVSNLIVEICFDNTAYTGDDDVFYSTTAFNSVVYDLADNDVGCSLAGPATSTSRPNTRFEFCSGGTTTYSWSPAAAVTDPNIAGPMALPGVSQWLYVDVNNGVCTVRDSVFITVGCVLPIEMTGLEGEKAGQRSHLFWETLSEQNSSFFAIERDEISGFSEIGRLSAAGNSTSTRNYQFFDENPMTGINRYRLRMVDLDGKTELSNVVEIDFRDLDQTRVLRVYPNPSQGEFTFELSFARDRQADLAIYDAAGKQVASYGVSGQGEFSRKINLGSLSSGMYFYELRSGAERSRGKLMVE